MTERVLVDSNVWIDYFSPIRNVHTESLTKILESNIVCVGELILVEVLQGFARDNEVEVAQQVLTKLEIVQISSPEIALKAAANYRYLRKNGITIRKTIDMLIATWAIENEVFLLHKHADFDRIAAALPLNVVPTE